MNIPPKIANNNDHERYRRVAGRSTSKVVADKFKHNNKCHQTKSRITMTSTSTPTPTTTTTTTTIAPYQVIHSHSVASTVEDETQMSGGGCSAQTQQAGTTSAHLLILEGIGYHKNKQYAKALQLFNTVLKSQMLHTDGDHPFLAITLANIGSVYLRQGRYQYAEESLRMALVMIRRLRILFDKRCCDEEEEEEGMMIVPKVPSLAGVLNNLGTVKSLQGNHRDSLEYYWGALKDGENHGDSTRREISNSLYNIGRISFLLKNYPVALRMLNASLRLEKQLHGEGSVKVVDTLDLIGFVCLSSSSSTNDNNKLLGAAMIILTEALLITSTHYGSVHEKVAISLLNVGMVLEKQGRLDDALRSFNTAHDIFTKLGLTEYSNRGMSTVIRSVNDIQELMLSREDNNNDNNDGNNNNENHQEDNINTIESSSLSSILSSNRNSKISAVAETTPMTTTAAMSTAASVCSNVTPTYDDDNIDNIYNNCTIYKDLNIDSQSYSGGFGCNAEYREDSYMEFDYDDSSISSIVESRDDA
ncbi:TPR-like protein [Fragilariopsis cylindrus CCMP1102]|uniref:TPR-like protein n=1 Tax=Fragilariopsis cylindrus CCMP1102 TaxID=635003 RepID=A0A1E7FSJ7_9STRA|nr:TPR-like protein [Fragilariopsis cylindrus CCMP1102]|eukprot:OEU21116.1 TPR-like protein [Fragilariopsis cylindrus CCMP1102]